jgi:hypothetical protein
MNARFCSPAVRLLILSLVAVTPGAFCAPATGTVQFITDVYGRNENAGNAALTVTRNGDTNSGCSVNWSVTGGSAVALNDYSPTSGTLNFAAGETFKNISLFIVDDALVESNETVNLTLSGAVNATISFPSNAVLTIFDNDVSNPPPATVVQFITDVYGRNENAGNASLTVTRSGDTSNACSVSWSVTGGSATSGADYSPASGTLNFAAFETFRNISLLIVDDALVESNETVNLALSGAVNATIGFPSNAVLTIFDNDVSNPPPVIQFVSSVYGRFENQTAPLNLERLGDTNVSCSVQWSYTGGTAVPFSDFFGGSSTINFAAGQTMAALPISIVDDTVAEPDETAGFSLQNPINATLGSPSSATLTIYDNDVSNPPPATVVQFITDVYGRNENAGDASLTVTRSGNTSNACSVNWSVTGGSATFPADYSPSSGTLNFAAFETFKNVSLLIVDDGIVESNETVNLTLSGATNATIGFPSNAVLTIFDNDVSNPPPVTVVQFITDVYGRFEDAGDASLTVTRSGNTSNTCSVNWSVNGGSATSGSDYSPVSGTLNFAANETFKNISLLIVDDPFVEGSETVNLILSDAVNATIGSPSNAVLTIYDNDTLNPTNTDLAISVHPETNFWLMGQERLVQFAVTNRGPNNASNVVVHAPIPSGFQFTGTDGNVIWLFNFNAGTWTRENVLVTNAVSFFGYRLRATNGGVKTFTGTITNSQPADSFAGNNTATTNLTVLVSLSVTGQVQCASNGPPLPGVTITLTTTNAPARVSITDANGGYAFTNLTPALYTVTPSTNGFSFLPPNQIVDAVESTNLPAFVAMTRFITGLVRTGTNGSPVPGIVIQLSGAANAMMLTDSSGTFLFTNLNAGNYTVTPLTNGLPLASFAPTNATFEIGNPTNCTNSVVFFLTNDIVVLRALEVNQAIQDWENSVPLVQDKSTLVRAFLQLPGTNDTAISVSGAVLHGSRGGAALAESPLTNATMSVWTNDIAPFRSNLSASMNFVLPPDWLNGTIDLVFSWTNGAVLNVEPREASGLGVGSNGAVRVSFTPVPSLPVKWVMVSWSNGFGNSPVTVEHAFEIQRRLRAMYPISRVTPAFAELNWFTNEAPTESNLLSRLSLMRTMDIIGSYVSGNTNASRQLYYGFATFSKMRGEAAGVPDSVSCGNFNSTHYYNYQRHLAQHEIGHTLGRHHAVNAPWVTNRFRGKTTILKIGICGEGAPTNAPTFPMLPHPGGGDRPVLGPLDAGEDKKIFGYDNQLNRILDPRTYFDLMSYCAAHGAPWGTAGDWPWISKHTYTNLMNILINRFGANNAPPPPTLNLGQEHLLIVRGRLDVVTDEVNLDPFVIVPTAVLPPSPLPGEYALVLLDEFGQVVTQISFQPSAANYEDIEDSGVQFSVTVPYDPAIRGLVLYRNGVPISQRIATPSTPSVNVSFPNGGETVGGTAMLQWTASDLDGDELSYTLQFSSDGGTSWQTLVADWPFTSYPLSTELLHATTAGRIRVIATDGFNTAIDDTDGLFTIGQHSPVVSIGAPVDQQVFIGHEQVALDAAAFDAEDGALTNITWISSLNGVLGTGEILVHDATTLSEGTHLLTATAIDSTGLTNAATVSITIYREQPPLLAIERLLPDVLLSWPVTATNYHLQRALSLPGAWADVTNTVQIVDDKAQVTLPASGQSKFFRLIKP